MSRKLNVDKVQESLNTKRLGRCIIFSRKIDSTNKWAWQLASCGAQEGTVTVAETQMSGRGRLNRQWISPAGGLWFSVILRPSLRVADACKLMFVAGLAVAKVLRKEYGLKVETKWPNDVLLRGRKVCGILAETKTLNDNVDFVVIGIGINVNFDANKVFIGELKETATSLMTELGKEISLNELFKLLLEAMESLYERFSMEGFGLILEEWKEYATFLGHHVQIACNAEKLWGKAVDVDREGALILRLDNGTVRRVFAGDVSMHMKQAGQSS